ncbi:HalOD1 output domain-containing protein [Natrialba chahannaoensis]|nr:HalOD1 output domain-containing protein [Natrialba chahannaoensis]
MGTGIDPSQNVIQQIAAIEGLEPAELEPPLYKVIDPHALDALVQTQTRTKTIGVVREAGAGSGTETKTDTEPRTGTGEETETGTERDGTGTNTGTDATTGTETAYTPTAGLSQIVFTYRGHRVQVDGTGAVEITPHHQPGSGSGSGSTEDAQSD